MSAIKPSDLVSINTEVLKYMKDVFDTLFYNIDAITGRRPLVLVKIDTLADKKNIEKTTTKKGVVTYTLERTPDSIFKKIYTIECIQLQKTTKGFYIHMNKTTVIDMIVRHYGYNYIKTLNAFTVICPDDFSKVEFYNQIEYPYYNIIMEAYSSQKTKQNKIIITCDSLPKCCKHNYKCDYIYCIADNNKCSRLYYPALFSLKHESFHVILTLIKETYLNAKIAFVTHNTIMYDLKEPLKQISTGRLF